MKNELNKNSFAQGTIEYLVVIAVVVVVSLIIVALVINVSSSPSQQVLDSSDKLGNVAVGGISIVEAVSDLDGDTLISLMNNSSEGITLKKISVGENDNNYDDYISGVDSVPISLTGLASSCPCESGQKNVKCEFVFEYLTKSGLTKIERRTINVQCTNSNNNPTPSNPNRVIEPIVIGPADISFPSIVLFSPTSSESRSVDFNFSVSDDSGISSCTLFVGEDSNIYNNISSGLNIITYEFSTDKLVDWNISCIDSSNNTGYSDSLNLNVDSNQYQITTCLELQDMNNGLTGNYELMNNVDCGLDTNNSSGALWNGGLGFKPIGNSSSSGFTGAFNGNNYEISNLYIRKSSDYLGLFGYSTGVISNVKLVDVNMIGFGSDIWWRGILVARQVGGSITNSSTTGTLLVDTGPTAALYIGGLIGHMKDGSLTNSYSLAHIIVTGSSNERIGGLVGFQESGIISSCYFGGDVNGRFSVGGLVGHQGQTLSATIINSYSDGVVSGVSQVGGLVGLQQSSYLSNSYFSGTVTASSVSAMIGGILGNASSWNISDSFSVGQVISNSDYSGGFVGTLQGSTLNNVYWDTHLSGKTNCYNNVSGIDSNVDCSLTNNADSDYFGESGIPFVSLNFDGNWIDQDDNYPKLSWQHE